MSRLKYVVANPEDRFSCNDAHMIFIFKGEFTDEGTETHFVLPDAGRSAYIKAVSSGKRRDGIVHELYIDDNKIPEAKE